MLCGEMLKFEERIQLDKVNNKTEIKERNYFYKQIFISYNYF